MSTEIYRCGRCENVKSGIFTRNRLFEDIARHLSFPCSYNHCDKRIPWGRVEEHEQNCFYRTVRCPVYYQKCTRKLRVDKILDHFKEKHSGNVKVIPSTWELKTQGNYLFLTRFDNQNFLVYILGVEESISIAVLALEPTKYSKFTVKLVPPSGDKFELYFRDLTVCRYDERLHCFKCIMWKCEEFHHPFSEKNKSSNENEPMDMSFTNNLKKELIDIVTSANGTIRYYITLQADESSEDQDLSADEEEEGEGEEEKEGEGAAESNLSSILLKALTCQYCMMYMAAPIFTCPIGHTICNVCKTKQTKCPMCATPYGNSRNYSLEDAAADAKVPCSYLSNGCLFVGSSSKVYVHEKKCSFKNLQSS